MNDTEIKKKATRSARYKAQPQHIKILVDSREQTPFAFTGTRFYQGVTCEIASLHIGDYSLPGLTDKVAVERKELGDLIQCLGRERDRFERELERGRGLDAFCVVVEATWQDIASHKYRSRFNPHAAGQSLAAFMARYRVPVIFAGSRKGAEYFTWSFLRQYAKGKAPATSPQQPSQAGPQPWRNWGSNNDAA